MSPTHRHVASIVVCSILCFGLFPSTPASSDQLVLAGDAFLSRVPLPGGSPDPELQQLTETIRELAYLDDGRLMAIRDIVDVEGLVLGHALVRIEADGTVIDVGVIEPPEDVFGVESPADLAVDAEGRLFMLSFVTSGWNPPDGYTRLVRLDPDDGSTVSVRILTKSPFLLATAPSGLWTLTGDGLELLDPDTGSFTFVRETDALANDGETDTTGALWLYGEGVCSPPCFLLSRLDPSTGALTNLTSQDLNPNFLIIRDLTVKRQCEGSTTALCLQGGRFKVEITWRDFANRQGSGTITNSRSADSGVFWFFDPANWELTVKVLDGCNLGGHYWVFASGSTNVEYQLTVTDLLTGAERSYDNPLGRTAVTVTDTTAFPCP